MKITVNIDCSPLEARNFLGLPDMTPVHEAYVKGMTDAVKNAGSAEQVQAMMQSFSPMGEASMNLFKQMMDIGTGSSSSSSKSGG
jgi:hypothetical protein